MSDAFRAALRQALAISLTALLVGSFHLPQPFLAVLAAQLIAGFACISGADFLKRITAAWAGSMAGLFLLVAAPDQQWISIPAFGVFSGSGIVAVFRRWGSAPAILFAMGIGGMFSAGLVYPGTGLISGSAHAMSLSIAAISSVLAWTVCMRQTGTAGTAKATLSPILIGLAASASLIVAALTIPAEAVVMTIATMTTIFALQTSPGKPGIAARTIGAGVGILVSVTFLVIVSGSGNNLAIFLAALALVMGSFEWLAASHPANGAMFRQAAALFAVAATMLPRPDQFLFGSLDRMLAVVIGFAVAVAFSVTPSRHTIRAFPGAQAHK